MNYKWTVLTHNRTQVNHVHPIQVLETLKLVSLILINTWCKSKHSSQNKSKPTRRAGWPLKHRLTYFVRLLLFYSLLYHIKCICFCFGYSSFKLEANHLNENWISSNVLPLVSGTKRPTKTTVIAHISMYSVNVPVTKKHSWH